MQTSGKWPVLYPSKQAENMRGFRGWRGRVQEGCQGDGGNGKIMLPACCAGGRVVVSLCCRVDEPRNRASAEPKAKQGEQKCK